MRETIGISLLSALLNISILVCQQLPSWTAPQPDPSKPLGGYKRIENTTNIEIFHGTNPNDTSYIQGAYNHASMIGYNNGTFIILWKNCQKDEDCNGQRILYSQSLNGKDWTKPDVMFQNLTVRDQATSMFVGPPIIINGRMYVGASPGPYNESHDQTAQGTQFCVWPEPIDTRNCGPPGEKGIYGQENNTLMMRQIKYGLGNIGPVFWKSNTAPSQFQKATQIFSIPTVNEMDQETQNDISLLTKQMKGFCPNNNSGTLKCEVCNNQCQNYQSINQSLHIGNERTHYILPSKDKDILLYRCNAHALYVSVRNISIDNDEYGHWLLPPQLTNIPNDNSNMNAGLLPDNRIYLVSNPVTPTSGNGRDPITIATSKDGYIFDKVGVVMTCTNLSATSQCLPRYQGHAKNTGPSYPQALTIIDPAPKEIQGIYVVATNNKEDVWLTHMTFDAF